MPCNTIQTSQISMSNAQPDVLAAALESLGYRVTRAGDGLRAYAAGGRYALFANGELEIASRDAKKVSQAYGREIVKSAAKQFGWQLSNQAGQENKFLAVRRY